jgi:hypothetical protein
MPTSGWRTRSTGRPATPAPWASSSEFCTKQYIQLAQSGQCDLRLTSCCSLQQEATSVRWQCGCMHLTIRRSCAYGDEPVAPAAEVHTCVMAARLCRSVFYLPKPRPLSHLVADLWRGPTLVLQGALDPLNDAKGSEESHDAAINDAGRLSVSAHASCATAHVCAYCAMLHDIRVDAPCVPSDGACGPAGRAEALRKCCPNVDVKLLNAGHCPHDEAPTAVNEALLEFLSARSLPRLARAQS